RIRDDDDLTIGGGQGRRRSQLGRVPRERDRELAERREAKPRLGDALEQDLPAPLVTEDVVEVQARRARRRDDGARTLGERERLVDQGTLGRGEQLARE